MSKKYEVAVRGLDVKVMPRRVSGPWHSMMYGVYTRDGELLGLFVSNWQALDYALGEGHRIRNMLDVLLGAAEEIRISEKIQEMLKMLI